MQEENIYEDIDTSQSVTQEYLGLSLAKFIILVLMVLAFGIYIGLLLYGTNSIEILFGLQEYQTYLSDESFRLKHENAELQSKFFELKEISGQ